MTRTSVLLAALCLLVAAPAAGAANLLDTLTVDPGASAPATGNTVLHPGTRYSMEVSGTFQETGPEGYGFKYDALYCFDGVGFDPSVAAQQCPHSGSNDHSNRGAQIAVGVGSTLANADDFGSASNPGHDKAHEVAYDANHSYGFAFFAPETGKLKAGGPFAFKPCPTCKTSFAGGPIVIKLYGPATSTGGGGGGGGGGGKNPKVETLSGIPVSDGGPVTCVPASRATAFAAAKMCPFGQVAVKDPPPAQTPVDVSSESGIDPNAVIGDNYVDTTQASLEGVMLMAAIKNNTQFRDLFEGCLLFGDVEPEANFVRAKSLRERLVYLGCAELLIRQLKKKKQNGRRVARAAGRSCQVTWVPIWKPGSHPTRREYRAAVAENNREHKTGCQYGAKGGMTFSLVGRHGPVGRSLGGRARAVFARADSSSDRPNAKLHYRWRTTG